MKNGNYTKVCILEDPIHYPHEIWQDIFLCIECCH
jgi:hypothetical protein